MKVDQGHLNDNYYKSIVNQYKHKLRKHNKYVPIEEVKKHFDFMVQTHNYRKLIGIMAEWLALIEVCDDLLNRIEIYGIAHYLDLKIVEEILKKNWGFKDQSEQ